MQLNDLETPALALYRSKLERNLERMNGHTRALSGVLRPHVQTVKAIDTQRWAWRIQWLMANSFDDELDAVRA